MTDRQLDALVAERVMGLVVHKNWYKPHNGPDKYYVEPQCDGHKSMQDCPHYSTNIADAWAVLQKFDSFNLINHSNWEFFAELFDNDGEMHSAKSDSIPQAICLAALQAVGEEEE